MTIPEQTMQKHARDRPSRYKKGERLGTGPRATKRGNVMTIPAQTMQKHARDRPSRYKKVERHDDLNVGRGPVLRRVEPY